MRYAPSAAHAMSTTNKRRKLSNNDATLHKYGQLVQLTQLQYDASMIQSNHIILYHGEYNRITYDEYRLIVSREHESNRNELIQCNTTNTYNIAIQWLAELQFKPIELIRPICAISNVVNDFDISWTCMCITLCYINKLYHVIYGNNHISYHSNAVPSNHIRTIKLLLERRSRFLMVILLHMATKVY